MEVGLEHAPRPRGLIGDGQDLGVVADLDLADVDAPGRDQIGRERGIAGMRRGVARPERGSRARASAPAVMWLQSTLCFAMGGSPLLAAFGR